MATLVTGGAGYIGSVMVDQLLDRGEPVVVLDDLSRGHREAVDPIVPFYEGRTGDGELGLDARSIDVLRAAGLTNTVDAGQAPHAFAFDVLDTGTRYVAIEGRVRGFIVMEPRDLEEALGGDQLWHRCE